MLPAVGRRCRQGGLFKALQASYLFFPFWPSSAGPQGDGDPAVWISPWHPQTLPAPAAPSALHKDQPLDHTLALFFWLARPTYTSRYSDVFLHTHSIPFVAKFMGESSLQRNPLWPPLNSAGSPVEVVPQLFPRFGRNCPKPGQKLSSHWAEGHI